MSRRVAFVHPGQGSHRPNMATAWRGTPQAAVIEEVGAAAGLDLALLADDADACGGSTALGQPAILAVSLAADAALRAAGVAPDVVAGHSLGELTAAASAGVLTTQAVGDVVAERGRAMGEACARTPGAMAAVVKVDPELVAATIAEFDDVAIANQNARGQVVIAGAQPQFDAAVDALRGAGGRCIGLKVEGAFHSPAMAPAVVALDTVLRRHQLADPQFPVVTGVNGSVLRSAAEVHRHLVDGILSPVRWVDVQDRLVAMGVEVLVEVGPGGVLAGIARRAHPELTVATVAGPDDVAAVVELVGAVPAPV